MECEHLGIDLTGHHRAMADTLATFQILNYLLEKGTAWDLEITDILSLQHKPLAVTNKILENYITKPASDN